MRPSADLTVISDDVLVDRVRSGDDEAYVTLYERHAARARRVARSALDDAGDSDDVVSEAFAAVLSALRGGKGPTEGFVGYLVSAVRNEAYRANRRRTRQRAVTDRGRDDIMDPYGRRDEAAVLRDAFDTLPAPAREVLWRAEIDGESHADIAAAVGTSVQAVATRAARARQALGGAYLAGHLGMVFDEPPATPECAECRRLLVDLVRGTLRPRRGRQVEAHLASCAACRRGRHQLEQLNERLRTSPPLLPIAGAGMSIAARLGATFAPIVATGAAITMAVVGPINAPPETDASSLRTASVTADATTTPAVTDEPARAIVAAPRMATPDDVDPVPVPPTTPGTAPPRTDPPTTQPAPAPTPVTEPPPSPTTPGPSTPGRPAPGPPVTPPPPLITVPPVTVVPEITVPPVTVVPGITVPPVTVVPEITVPPVTVVPEITVPPVGVGPIATPPIAVPPIGTPPIAVPPIATAPIGVPPIETPPVTVPPVVPTITVPPVVPPILPSIPGL